MKSRPKLLMLIITLLAATSAPLSAAQSEQLSVEQSNQTLYSDAELKALAEAEVEVERINGVYKAKLEAAKTFEEEDPVRKAAINEVTEVLRQKGMSVEKYREILMVAQNNAEVAERIRQHIKGMM